MKQAALAMFAAILCGAALADTATVTVTATGADAYSDPISISGWLDRVEVVKTGNDGTATIDLATFTGTTALETFVDLSVATGAVNTVVVPRIIGTTIAGADLAAATAADTGAVTNGYATTILHAGYDRAMVGGNLKLKVGVSAGTNATAIATIYYLPTKK